LRTAFHRFVLSVTAGILCGFCRRVNRFAQSPRIAKRPFKILSGVLDRALCILQLLRRFP
jgi:hypothetical protein